MERLADKILLQKIDNKDELSEHELSILVRFYEVEREEGKNNRWTQSIRSYIKINDRFFSVDWESGLTEYQDNSFLNQPQEVENKTYEKVIPEHKVTVTEWIPK